MAQARFDFGEQGFTFAIGTETVSDHGGHQPPFDFIPIHGLPRQNQSLGLHQDLLDKLQAIRHGKIFEGIAGFIGGFQFPLVNKIYLDWKRGMVAAAAGLTYGVDLFGSCLGALFTGAFLIPVMGIPKTCYAIGFLNLAMLIILFFSSQRRNM